MRGWRTCQHGRILQLKDQLRISAKLPEMLRNEKKQQFQLTILSDMRKLNYFNGFQLRSS
jgi:hypothetical protein